MSAVGASGPITVVARWQVQDGLEAGVLELVAELRHRTLQEPGCLGYDVFQSRNTPGEILLLERYRDDEALATHRDSAHYRQLVVERIIPMLAARTVELLQLR